MAIKTQLIVVVVYMLLSNSCIFGEECQCEGLVNILKSTMSMEIFDLKLQNNMLQIRMDKLESMLRDKPSSTSSQDITQFAGFEDKFVSIESNMQHTIEVSSKALKLSTVLAKALQSEKSERIKLQADTMKHIHHFNESITDFKSTIHNVLKDNLTYIVDDMEKVDQQMNDYLVDVKNDVKIFQSNISELQSQTYALMVNNITDLELDLAFVSEKFSKSIAEFEQRVSNNLLDIKRENAEAIFNVTNLRSITSELVEKNITVLETNVVAIDKNVLEMEADIKSLQDMRFFLRKSIVCPELPSVDNGEVFQNTSDGLRNTFESVSEITCNTGYYVNDNLKVYKRQCQADGTWSGNQPVCEGPKCEDISLNFYGGRVHYFGDRGPYSFAMYRCDEAYTLFPNRVDFSECGPAFKWTPAPPVCLKMAKVVIPNNG